MPWLLWIGVFIHLRVRRHVSNGVMAGGQRGDGLQCFRNRRIFGNFNASSENFLTSAVGKDKSLKYYRKIIELGPPTLQVPRPP